MEPAPDHYATLGVGAQADAAAIRSAYRALMRRYHPDVNGSADAAAKATAINEAYACLGDEEKRATYDWSRKAQATAGAPHRAYRPPPRPMHAQHTHWHQRRSFTAELEPDPPPTRWKVASLGLALLVTLATFAFTSATPPPMPVPPPPPAEQQPATGIASGYTTERSPDAAKPN